MAAIDIGPDATDRATTTGGANQTLVQFGNPADGTGKITYFEIWFPGEGAAEGVKAGTFFGSGTSYTSRDFELLGDVTKGSKQTFSGLDCDVVTGDFVGTYTVTGSLELDTGGGSGRCQKTGDQFGAGQQTYETAGQEAWVESIYGTGTTTPVAGVGAFSQQINPFGINIYKAGRG